MKKSNYRFGLLCVTLILGILFPSNQLFAEIVTAYIGDFRYSVDTENQTAEVFSLKDASKPIHNLVIPDYIDYQGVQIPVTSIKNSAFQTRQLTGSLTIGNNVRIIGSSAFERCTGLNGSLTIGKNVEIISIWAFKGCSGLTGSLNIPDNVKIIDDEAFSSCSGFNGSLNISDKVEIINRQAFFACSGFTGSLIIPDNVQTIGDYAFMKCSGFTGSLSIGNNVQSIGYQAFCECSGITGNLTIPKSVRTIGEAAFWNCKSFTGSLTIPDNVQTIGDKAFYLCNFSEVTSSSVEPANAGANAFYNFYSSPLYVPAESVNLYKNAMEWEKFTNINPISIEATGITLNKTELTLLVGQGETLLATLTPENATSEIVWCVEDNNDVISVVNGKVTALAKGTATVIASAGDVSATCKVTVYGPDDVTVKPGDGTIPGDEDDTPGNNTENGGSLVGNDLTLRVNQSAAIDLMIPEGLSVEPKFAWSLDNGGAEFVSMTVKDNTLSATFKGLNVGQTGYKVSIIGVNGNIEAVKGKITVIAEVPMISLELEPSSITIAKNALPQTIIPVYTPVNASMPQFNWTCSVPTVATVDQKGEVTPVGQGQTVITCTALDGSGLSAICTVTITAPIDENFEFEFDESVMGGKEGISLYIGDTYQFNPKAQDGYVLPEVINWSSSDNQKVSVNDNGLVTALAIGKATITASATVNDKEVKATCEVTVIPILANKVILSAENLNLLVGQTDKLTATVEPANTTDQSITWKSESESIATVGTDGTVTALAIGVANITAICGEATATCKVTVYGPDDVTVKPGDGTSEGDEDDTPGNNTENGGSLVGNDLTLRINQTAAIDLVIPEGLSVEPKFAWTLDNGGAELVNMTVKDNTLSATFKGLKVGQTGYTVSIIGVNGNIEAAKGKITVIAEIPMTSLELDPASITMAQNALPQTIIPVYTPDNASMPEFSWTSSVPTVATVDQNGKVTPVAQGQTVISCTALDGSELSATSTVTVTAPIDEDFGFDESVMGGVEGVTIYLGDTYTLVPKAHDGYQLPENITWSSSDDKTVSVDRNGKVTGLALGSATISATATINGKEITATCTVTVIPIKVSAIELSQTSAELRATETLTLTATIEPNNATDKSLQWTTNAPSIATVSQEGVVTALMIGEANITARALDGSNATASCKVKVVPTIATGITVKADGSTSIKAKETVQLTATVTPETTTDKTVTWKSDKPAIATVTNSGVVTGVAVGEALITATNSAGQSADIKITVIPTPVETIELNRYTAQIRVQDGFKLNANILPLTATNKTVDWTSSAPEIVSVDNEGNVLALALGNATITCEAQDGSGVKAECQITVTTTATQSVSITAEGSTTLKATETVQLKATVLPATASDKSVRWQSASPDIATVDNTGLVTAISVGTVQITATNSGGQTACVTITVIPTPVESIKLNKTSATLKATETLELIATVNPESATDKSLEWGSDNEAVAMVNQNGVVTAVATGEANITVKAKDGSNVTATCKVNVIATEVTSITITANGATTLKASENVQLIATILPETATDKSVTWSASAPEKANVNENGLVTAYAVGESVITATASSGLTAEITITVIPTPVSNITLNRTSLTMRVGNERRLTATIQPETATDKSVTWASSNPEIATVDGEGNVIALLEGQTSVTCMAKDGSGISASCIVNVVDTDVETVLITAEGSTTIKVSETVQLTATVMPETSTNKSISWSSGNEKVATVDAEGLVTAMSEGVTVITATTSNGLSDSITITVVETQVTSITLNETSIILQANDTYNLIPTINPQTATNKEVIWTSGNADIATINQDGTVTAIMVGETSISASAADGSGVTASCKVTVIPTPATSITITMHGETTLEINQTVQLTAEVLPENATDKSVVWTSSNEAVASVTETGLVTALSAGETVISATNSAGQYDRVTITVISNEPDEPEWPKPIVSPADTPTQLLRKGDGTSHTFVAMMEKDDEVLEAENYRYVFGYNIGDGTSVIEDTPWRYAHTNEDIYWDSSNDFWVFAYYVDDEGTVHVSSRRHLDGSIDIDFNAADLIGSATRSGEHIVGIYTVDGQFVGKDINKLETGIFIIRTSTSSYKIIR